MFALVNRFYEQRLLACSAVKLFDKVETEFWG